MAERYGGKYSPDRRGEGGKDRPPVAPGNGPNPWDGKRRSRAGGRINMLFAAPVIILLTSFQGSPRHLAFGIAAFCTLVLATWLTKQGILAQQAYEARKIAKRPAIPRKIFGAVLTGIGLALGTVGPGEPAVQAAAFGLIGVALHLLAFGPDPLSDKGMEGVDAFQTDRVARAVEEGEKHLAAMRDAILRAGDRQLEGRIDRFSATARGLFRTVENDPGDLTAARKYLGVYLLGARDATVKFADLYAQGRDPSVRADYESLLTDLETHFASRTQALLTNNRSDLDVEIDVLRERLDRDTPRPLDGT